MHQYLPLNYKFTAEHREHPSQNQVHSDYETFNCIMKVI